MCVYILKQYIQIAYNIKKYVLHKIGYKKIELLQFNLIYKNAKDFIFPFLN